MPKINDIGHQLNNQMSPKGKFLVAIVCVFFIISIVVSLIADENNSECHFLGQWKALEYQGTEKSVVDLNSM
ncbi:MAG: hypothetical protein LBS60_06100 [Deltaproteobacteria bacterium]|jgi:hypothetical protein|nr:hypothetical protein [Deltaproteobacteria bacterium]